MLHQSNTDWGKAREAFESASVFYPDADAGRQAEAFYAVGFVLQKQDRHEDAIKRFDQALQRDNRQGKAHYARALSLMHLKKRDEAVAALKQASSSEGNAGVKAREALQMLGE